MRRVHNTNLYGLFAVAGIIGSFSRWYFYEGETTAVPVIAGLIWLGYAFYLVIIDEYPRIQEDTKLLIWPGLWLYNVILWYRDR